MKAEERKTSSSETLLLRTILSSANLPTRGCDYPASWLPPAAGASFTQPLREKHVRLRTAMVLKLLTLLPTYTLMGLVIFDPVARHGIHATFRPVDRVESMLVDKRTQILPTRSKHNNTTNLSLVPEPNSDDEKLVVEGNGVGKGSNENGRISHTQTPEIEKFDRIRAAVNDKRGATASGFGNGGGPPSPPHNVFVGSGGVGMESNDDDGGDGDRIRSVCNGLAGRGAQFGAPFLVISVQ